MALYENMYVFVNGQVLAENVTIESSLDSDIQDVNTQVKEWAGITPAPITRTTTLNNVIPRTGVEFDAEAKMIAREEIEVMLQEGSSGKKCTSKGYITAAPRSSGVGQNTTLNFTVKGTPSSFK